MTTLLVSNTHLIQLTTTMLTYDRPDLAYEWTSIVLAMSNYQLSTLGLNNLFLMLDTRLPNTLAERLEDDMTIIFTCEYHPDYNPIQILERLIWLQRYLNLYSYDNTVLVLAQVLRYMDQYVEIIRTRYLTHIVKQVYNAGLYIYARFCYLSGQATSVQNSFERWLTLQPEDCYYTFLRTAASMGLSDIYIDSLKRLKAEDADSLLMDALVNCSI